MDFVNEQDGLGALAQGLEQRLEAFLEVTPVLGARQQGTQVQGVDHGFRENIGDFAIDNALGQTFGDGGLANARLAHQQRVVLAPAHQNLRDPLNLLSAAYQRINPTQTGLLV